MNMSFVEEGKQPTGDGARSEGQEPLAVTNPQTDLVADARELLCKPMSTADFAQGAHPLLRKMADELERLRKHIMNLDHDFDAAIKHCNKHHVEGIDS